MIITEARFFGGRMMIDGNLDYRLANGDMAAAKI
jgi:hypothetical protein